jgi:hypothetical protein
MAESSLGFILKSKSLLLIGMTLTAVANSQAVNVYGLTTRDQLVSFSSATPGTLNSAVFISGLANNESLVGIDFRPANNMLYGVGSFGRVYTLYTMTGAATFVAGLTNSVGGAPISLSGVEFGMDFNPAADRIRLIGNLGQNLRINPMTGVTVVDGAINGPATHIVSSAYTNNDNDTSTGTALYNVDSVQDVLTIQTPPNNGTQAVVGSLGLDLTALSSFDIFTNGATNTAFLAHQPVGSTGS